ERLASALPTPEHGGTAMSPPGHAPQAVATARALGGAPAAARIGAYAELSKFGIVLLVLVSAGAGFMLRAPLGADFPWLAGLLVLVGVMLLSCGASALNQVQERRRDALMARTAGRPIPSGRLSTSQGLVFAVVGIAARPPGPS